MPAEGTDTGVPTSRKLLEQLSVWQAATWPPDSSTARISECTCKLHTGLACSSCCHCVVHHEVTVSVQYVCQKFVRPWDFSSRCFCTAEDWQVEAGGWGKESPCQTKQKCPPEVLVYTVRGGAADFCARRAALAP